MAEDQDNPQSTDRDDPDDTGEPIVLLQDLGVETREDFIAGVRRSIYRRSFAGQLIQFVWDVPATVIMETLRWATELVESKTPSTNPTSPAGTDEGDS